MTDASLPSSFPIALCSNRAGAFASVEVQERPEAVSKAWAELEATAACSAYQRQDFVLAWLETLGKARGIEPFFLLARDAEERVTALFCFGIEQRGGIRRAVFLGGKEANFNLGLFRAPEDWTRDDLENLLRAGARSLKRYRGRTAFDAFVLLNQPHAWAGRQNPMALLPHQASPSSAYGMRLPRDANQYLAARQSKERRKKLRKKEARLAEMGELEQLTNSDEASARAILAAFFAQKIARCEAQAIDLDFADPIRQSFFERLALHRFDHPPPLELHALACASRIVATFGGLRHRDAFNGMVISFDADEEIARSSPGELLLVKTIAAQCEKGVAHFDLGIGEADYKATYCDTEIPLFDSVLPVTLKGRIYVLWEAARLRLKRFVKKHPELLTRLRRIKYEVDHMVDRPKS